MNTSTSCKRSLTLISDLGLKPNDLTEIINIFNKNPNVIKAVVFGSRAKGDYKIYSDVDIAIYGAVDINEIEKIICDLDDLPLIYKFDVVARGLIKNRALCEHIDRVGVTIYERSIV